MTFVILCKYFLSSNNAGGQLTTRLQDFLQTHGLRDFTPQLDGGFHEVKENSFKGWYIGGEKKTTKGAQYITFTLGDWRTGEKYTFIDGVEELSSEEKKEYKKQQKIDEEKITKEKLSRESEVAIKACKEYEAFKNEGVSPYLIKKSLSSNYGAKSVKNSWGKLDLIIPMKDAQGKIWGYQTIDETGEKAFVFGQKIEGCYYQFGSLNDDVIFICEGFATGASIYEATKKPVVVAFNTANLESVGKAIRTILPKKPIVFCADDDRFKKRNYGKEKAIKASQAIQAQVIFPRFEDLRDEPTDFNDMHIQLGLDKVRSHIFSHRFYPPEETIKTENTGFHDVEYREGGVVHIPNIDDLRLFFDRKYNSVVLSTSEIVYVWTGTHYEEYHEPLLKAFAEAHFDPKPNNKTVSEFVQKVYRTNVAREDWFGESAQGKINLQNGVFDFAKGELLPHDKRYGFRYCLPYKYDPNATCSTWEKFLNDVTQGDMATQKVIEEFIGYTLSGDTCWLQKALVLEGNGNNGKSTFISTFLGLLGEHNCTAASLASLNSESNRQTLDGKLANLAEENESTLGDSTTFKNLVSGGRMLVRQLYKKPYYMKNRAKLVLSFNTLPTTRDVTDAYFRRFILIPFRATFTRGAKNHDPFMEQKLEREYSGIFNKCVAAYKEVIKREAFTVSEVSETALKEYRGDLDPFLEWAMQHLEVFPYGNGHDKDFAELKTIYASFASYLEHNNYKEVSSKAFVKRLREHLDQFNKRYDFARKKDNEEAELEERGTWKTKRVVRAVKYHE